LLLNNILASLCYLPVLLSLAIATRHHEKAVAVDLCEGFAGIGRVGGVWGLRLAQISPGEVMDEDTIAGDGVGLHLFAIRVDDIEKSLVGESLQNVST
jgi:hypothetical protein